MQLFSFSSCRRSGCHPVAQWFGSLFDDDKVAYCHNNAGQVTDYISECQIRPIGKKVQQAGISRPTAQLFMSQTQAGQPAASDPVQDFLDRKSVV